MRSRERYVGPRAFIVAVAAAVFLSALLTGAGMAAARMPVAAGARAAGSGGAWGKAQEVPGVAALGPSVIISVSCASAGNCSAGGSYEDGTRVSRAFVVSQAR
jgi:hypothetical protein